MALVQPGKRKTFQYFKGSSSQWVQFLASGLAPLIHKKHKHYENNGMESLKLGYRVQGN